MNLLIETVLIAILHSQLTLIPILHNLLLIAWVAILLQHHATKTEVEEQVAFRINPHQENYLHITFMPA